MEILSSSQLHGYEAILEEITNAHERSEKLKKQIKNEEDKVIAHKLSTSKHKQPFSHVTIKIFSSVFEIYNLYEKDLAHCDFQGLSNLVNCKYYLIEIYIAPSLIQKLLSCDWKLQLSIRLKKSNITKIVSLRNKVPIVEIIPVDSDVRECILETLLFSPLQDYWNIIDLNTVNIDISYHFQSNKEIISTRDKSSIKLTKLYSSDVELGLTEKQMQSQLSCSFAKLTFIESVIKNCYHKIDLQLFSQFSGDEDETVDLQLFIEENKILLSYNPLLKKLKIKCASKDLLAVKKYFISCSGCDVSKLVPKLQVWLTKNQDLEASTLSDALSLYKNVRKLLL